MNVKSVIFVFLLIGYNALEAVENVTNKTILSTNQTTKGIDKKIDVPTNNADSNNNKDEAGFMSKLSNYIFGEKNDAETAETHQFVQYGAPPQSRSPQECNPCNKEPWIPIATNYGHNTIVGFMQPHEIKNGHGGVYNQQNFHNVKPVLPSGGYGRPQVGNGYPTLPAGNYGPPPSPHVLENFKPPSPQQQDNYRPPAISVSQIQQDLYGLPPKDNYGPPAQLPSLPLPDYGPPQQNFAPSKDNYGPPQQNYGPPPKDNYGPPAQFPSLPPGDFGPPQQNYGPPKDNYGPPAQLPSLPAGDYGPPQQNYGPPKDNYGPPAPLPSLPSVDYGPPQPTYGPPKPQNDYGPPQTAPSGFNGLPPPGPSSFGNHYGAPKPIYKIPNKNYGPPINQPTFGGQKPNYVLGKSPRQIRPPFNRPHHQFGPPQPQPVYKYIPLNKGKYSNLPTNFKPPPPPPNYNPGGPVYNNFGGFVNQQQMHGSGDIKTQITNPEYLPPAEQLPLSGDHHVAAIPFPNLSSAPVAPLHNAQNFYDNFPQPGSNVEIPYESNVQIQQSIPVADFLASIEHPISIIRSPILDVSVANTSSQSDGYYSTVRPQTTISDFSYQPTYQPANEYGNYDDYKLSENPIVVDDTHAAAATNANKTVSSYNNLQSSEVSNDYINQILRGIGDYQTPPSTSMQPPPKGESVWLGLSGLNPVQPVRQETTKKPKQIQIIIPYTTNNNYDKKNPFGSLQNQFGSDVYRGSESKEVTAVTSRQPTTSVINIQDLFKNNNNKDNNYKNLPFDVIRLQKNIDGWTEQEYSKNMLPFTKASSTASTATTNFVPSKRIPDEYLTTLPYNPTETKLPTTTTRSTPVYHDHEPAGSNSKEYLESNLIATTEQSTTPKLHKLNKLQSWDKIHIAVSPLTKEKIYVVTPQPKSSTSSWRQSRENERNSTTFSISILPMRNKTADTNDVRVVLSEWPHLINNLATTLKAQSTSTTTPRPTSRHPLFGLMDLSSYAPPANSTIETYSGHSKVINAATASLRKRGTSDEKKVTTAKSTTTLK